MLADGRGRGRSGYDTPYTEAWEVSLSQHYHGQVLHWWEARSSICRREIGCQRSLVLELLRAALWMKSDATNA